MHLLTSYPGLEIVRTIPAKSDIAFVEYTDVPLAIAARDGLNNYVLGDTARLKVSFARA